jgi:nucleotide-binding universal stress UspA family protein
LIGTDARCSLRIVFKSILVPLDGSANAERVPGRISGLRSPGSSLHLVRVVPAPGEQEPTIPESLRIIEADSYLSFLAGDLGDGVRTEVRRGPVAEEILAAARSVEADLIAVSSYGESGGVRAPVGSTAGRLIQGAACPVFVLGPQDPQAPAPASRPGRVLVALDGSAACESCLEPARLLAQGSGATLILLHVIEPFLTAGDSAAAGRQEAETRRIAGRLNELVEGHRREGIHARSLIVRGDPAGEIHSQAGRRRVDLLCLSTAARGPIGRLFFGSVAQKLIGAAPVPVVAVRRGPSRTGS